MDEQHGAVLAPRRRDVRVTELSFRLVERPVRDGSAMRWIREWRADHDLRARARGWITIGAVAALLAVGVVGSRVATADPVDLTTGGAEEEFVVPVGGALEELAPVAAASAGGSPSSGAVVGTLPPSLPRRVTVVGDSQATALLRNAEGPRIDARPR